MITEYTSITATEGIDAMTWILERCTAYCESETVVSATYWSFPEFDDYEVIERKKPVYERVMKMRNPDGRPRVRPISRPLRLVRRDNIGVRNFQKR